MKRLLRAIVPAVLAALALAVALVPGETPALTQPGSHAAKAAEMRMMGPGGGDEGAIHPKRPMHPRAMEPRHER